MSLEFPTKGTTFLWIEGIPAVFTKPTRSHFSASRMQSRVHPLRIVCHLNFAHQAFDEHHDSYNILLFIYNSWFEYRLFLTIRHIDDSILQKNLM